MLKGAYYPLSYYIENEVLVGKVGTGGVLY